MSRYRTLMVGVGVLAGALILTSASFAAALPSSTVNRPAPTCTFKVLPTGPPRTLAVRTVSANIRQLPGVACVKITTVPKGTRLQATGGRARNNSGGSSSLWLQIRLGTGLAWVANSQVNFLRR